VGCRVKRKEREERNARRLISVLEAGRKNGESLMQKKKKGEKGEGSADNRLRKRKAEVTQKYNYRRAGQRCYVLLGKHVSAPFYIYEDEGKKARTIFLEEEERARKHPTFKGKKKKGTKTFLSLPLEGGGLCLVCGGEGEKKKGKDGLRHGVGGGERKKRYGGGRVADKKGKGE